MVLYMKTPPVVLLGGVVLKYVVAKVL